ncbi:MAG: hypothetical protein IJI50_04590 [Ruminococcus sp.]|nr:hypothetical protein [Ruminococcus sp.]
MTEKRFDEMMKAYCDPKVEPFTFEKKKKTRLRGVAVMAAALVLVILGAIVIPSLTGSKHSFVLTVGAVDDRLIDRQTGTVYSEHKVYDKDMKPVETYYVLQADFMLNGDDIKDVSYRSVNGFGRFSVFYNPDFDDYHDDLGWMCDSEGNIDSDYTGWRTYDFDDYYNVADIDASADWSEQYRYHIWYIAVDDNDMFLQPDGASESRNDIIELTVTFTDGETQTRRLSVTYPDGVMTVQEIG